VTALQAEPNPSGVQGYEARIDPEALGLHLLAFVFVRAGVCRIFRKQ
jgi:hypothetical protein